MSLKQKKHSENKKEQSRLQEKMEKRKKKMDIPLLPPYIYIISEGTKTEPYYIGAIASKINEKYREYSTGERIVVEGTGRNTKSLLEYARNTVDEKFPQAEEVWLMYDKDDFPLDNFDNTQYSAEGRRDIRKYCVAWSNECIELWFLLHFQEVTSNIGREKYIERLKLYIEYEKNKREIYDILKDKTEIAIARARRQYESYGDMSPSGRCPATRVYQLVENLWTYL